MTTQIAVRLSDEDLGYIDQLVAEGKAKSRADAVRGFIDAARKASRDAADAAAYAATDDPDDLEALARWAGGQRLDVE
ncbi:MAG: ribbon-helix-helix domain-containing protein [Mycobacterium leprae]